MAENVLNELLNDKIKLEILFKWLRNEVVNEDDFNKNLCSQGEFISYFLNFIHEEAPCFDKYCDTPQKVHTPKSIRKLDPSTKIKRRPALFTDCSETPSSPNTTTPKCNRLAYSKDANGIDLSYSSPVSPIYTLLNLNTPKSRPRPSTEKGLCLGDFITPNRKSARKKTPKSIFETPEAHESESKKLRRINPTNLNQSQFSSLHQTQNTFDFTTGNTETQLNDLDDRGMLAEERFKIASRKIEPVTVKKIVPLQRKEISPDLSLATYKVQLDRLIEIYLYFLSHNLVLNVTSELYFVISLVLRKQYDEITADFSDLTMDEYILARRVFNTIHNTFYFAVNVLRTQIGVLSLLEKSCLKLLISNVRLREFSGDLCKKIGEICEKKEENMLQSEDEGGFHVCFMSDTDNRENFPNDASFHAFRKQRDLFYEILRIWNDHHLSEGWSFSMALGGKIRTLLNLHQDSTNYRHLCRLFKSQLLMTSGTTNVEAIPENQLSFLSSIPNINSEKLSRLKSRLVTKTTSNGINALPNFPGQQEFYKEFISISQAHTFNMHLKDAFVHEIVLLNDSKFSCNELEGQETMVDVQTKKSFEICIKSLCLLAKFLGFLESFPYNTQTQPKSDKIITAEIELRQWEQPSFDLKLILLNAVEKGTLILTIPWVTNYLSMMDYTRLRLSYYESLYDILFGIYYKVDTHINMMLVRLCLGWLFELSHFPSELYYIWCTKNATSPKMQMSLENSLDALEIVDRNVIYICCPYLNEFKKLLQYDCAKNGTITVKHITPITAYESPTQLNEKRLKLQLEEAFLNSQPISVRKTVDFVSERVASACVKSICNRLVPEEKEVALQEFRKFLQEIIKSEDVEGKKLSTDLKMKCSDFTQNRLSNLKAQCVKQVSNHVKGKIPNLIKLLLAEDELSQTVKVCTTISSRMSEERINQWINSHIVTGIYTKDFDAEVVNILDKASKQEVKPKKVFSLPPTGNDGPHNPETKSAVKLVEHIRAISIEVLERSPAINQNIIQDLIQTTKLSFAERCDINECIASLINRLLFDLIILLIAHYTKLCDNQLLAPFVQFWKLHGDNDIFKTVVCSRNIEILKYSSGRSNAWDKLTDFICILLKERLMTSSDFETQCVAVYQQNWDSVTLKHLSTCFQGVADKYGKQNIGDSKFSYLLSFLSDFCSDMDLDF